MHNDRLLRHRASQSTHLDVLRISKHFRIGRKDQGNSGKTVEAERSTEEENKSKKARKFYEGRREQDEQRGLRLYCEVKQH